MTAANLSTRARTLAGVLEGLEKAVMAVSGGLDSRTLFRFAREIGVDVTPVFFRGPHMTSAETAGALAFLSEFGTEPLIVDVDILDISEVRANTRERCYHCKHALFTSAAGAAGRIGVFHILDGTNASDLGEFRPGVRALEELGVRSPLAEAGMTKADVRALARELGLDRPDQPARACLLTRFPYGVRPDRELLYLIGRAEDRLMDLGLADFRLRAPDEDKLVLKVDASEREFLRANLAVVRTALATDLALPVEIEFSERVSGFYDRRD